MFKAQQAMSRKLSRSRRQRRYCFYRPALPHQILSIVQPWLGASVSVPLHSGDKQGLGRLAQGFCNEAKSIVDTPWKLVP